MQKFYTDKPKLFECNVAVDGAALNETKVRLVLEFSDNKNLLFHGKLNERGKCEILIPALKGIEETEGNAILEVIAESTYFESWKDSFQVEKEKKVTVEVYSDDKEVIKEDKTPKVTVVETEIKKEVAPQPKPTHSMSPAFKKFKNYLREHDEINFNKVVKNKKEFIALLAEYKKATNATKNDISMIVEGIQEEARLLKS